MREPLDARSAKDGDAHVSDTIESKAQDMGLLLCEFGGTCDFCKAPPDARTWVLMSCSEDGPEASYYVCEKCLPAKHAEHVQMLAHYEAEWSAEVEPPRHQDTKR